MKESLPEPKPQLMIGWNPDALSKQGYIEPAIERFTDLLLRGAIEIRTIRPLEDFGSGKPSGATPDRAKYVRLVFESGVTQPRVEAGGQSYRFSYVPEGWLTELLTITVVFPQDGGEPSKALVQRVRETPGVHSIDLAMPPSQPVVVADPGGDKMPLFTDGQIRQWMKRTVDWPDYGALAEWARHPVTNIAVLDSGCSNPGLYRKMDPETKERVLNEHGSQVAEVFRMFLPNVLVKMWKVTELGTDQMRKHETGRYLKALQDAARPEHGIRVVNISRGQPDWTWIEKEAMEALEKAGILVVAAAGNSARSVEFPAGFPTVVGVGAVKPEPLELPSGDYQMNWSIWEDSCRGYDFERLKCLRPKTYAIDLVAPGAQLPIRGWDGRLSGTSFAAPIVTALAGLIFTIQPELTPADVRTILRNSCSGKDNRPATESATTWGVAHGYGLVNWRQALEQALALPTTAPIRRPDSEVEPAD